MRVGVARRWLGFVAGVSLLALPSAHAGSEARTESEARAQSDSGRQVVEHLHAALLSAMKRAKTLGYEGRKAELSPVVEASLDLPFMARLALGRLWRKLGEAEQTRWLAAFKELSISTYAARFDGFSGERFETVAVEEAPHDTQIVKTRLVLPDEDPVRLHYRMRRGKDGWRIIDVYLNGTVSEVALRRSEFKAVLDREGFDALVGEVEAKIQTNAALGDGSASTS